MGLKEKNQIDFNVWKITFLNIRIIFSPKEYQKKGKNYLEKNFNLNNWNLKTLLNLIPFIFGFSNMIWSRYQDQTIPIIFGKNLPKTTILKNEISWETFKYLKSKSIDKNQIKKIDLYSNSCIFEIENKDNEKLIGFVFSLDDKKNPKLGFSTNWKIILDSTSDTKNLFLKAHDIYYQLDEIPEKIESLEKIFLLKKDNYKDSLFTLEKKKLQKENEIVLKTNLLEKTILPESFLKNDKKLVKKNNVIGVLPNKELNFSTKNSNSRTKKQNFQETRKNLLKKEFNILFYKNGIQSNFIGNSSENEFSKYSFNRYSSKETLEIINHFLNLTSIDLDHIQNLSGYFYPDLERKKVYEISLKNILEKNEKNLLLKVQLPSSFIVAIKENSLINSLYCNSFPINYRKDNFFGINTEEPSSSKKSVQEKNDWKNSLVVENKKLTKKPFEDLDDSNPDSWFLPFNEENITKAINFENDFFLNFLEKESNNNQNYLDTSLFQNKNLDYHFLPFGQQFLLEKNPISLKMGDIYKRTSTFTTSLNEKTTSLEKTNFNFFETWEPISIESWMLVTQFSIGLFLLQLVKDLYKDYGRELVDYVLQFANSSGIDVEEIKEQYLYDDPGYRLIRKVKKQFKDIAGIDNILLQLGEIVWFLRNKGRSTKLKTSIPNGILLTGPPGTGKTLLVQAIAGEAQVPIIVESGSLLTDPQQKGKGIERLKKIFDHARKLAPCIIFIDEVDTLGEKRQNIIQTPMGSDELIESIYEKSSNKIENGFIPKPLNLEENTSGEKDLEYQLFRGEKETSQNEQIQQNVESKKTRLSLLTQFLVEMDGLKQRQGVIVIGATNRPNVLDPALIRPGRFDQILNLKLPGKQKRIEILKLYGKKLKTEKNISWEYLANRTRGFSAADIAAAMNESTIQSIINKTTHTIETVEKGIDLVTSYNNEINIMDIEMKSKDPFFLNRLAYYQAGKAVLSTILDNHPPIVVLHLWPRQKNARHSHLYENTLSTTTNKKSLEAQLIGLYAGKASEMIPLYGNKTSTSLKRWQSDLGEEDLISATFLSNLLVDKWYFYSMEVLIRKNNEILNTRNEKEFSDLEKLALSKSIDNEIEDELEVEKIAKLSRLGRYQQRAFGPWWQIQVANQISEIESFFADWYRIYLPDPEENILNLEWIPPDEYHHNNDYLKKLSEKSDLSFNDLYQIERDYVFHGLILNSFNTAFDLLEDQREFLDYFSDYLLRFEILRETEITSLLNNQNKENSHKLNSNLSKDSLTIIETFWGDNSRRKISRFVKLKNIKLNVEKTNYNSPFLEFTKE